MQQYRLARKKKKKGGLQIVPNAEFSSETRFIFDPLPLSFSLSHSTFIPRFANWRVFSWPSSKRQLEIYFRTELVSHPLYRGLGRLNAVRRNRHSFRESYLNSLRYRNVEEGEKKKKRKKKYKNTKEIYYLFFFFSLERDLKH